MVGDIQEALKLKIIWLRDRLGAGGIVVFIHHIAVRQFEAPVVASGGEPFQAHLILIRSLKRFYPNHAELDTALTILQREFVAGFQYLMNRAQASPIGSDVQGVDQFVDWIVSGVFPAYSHRQYYFDTFVPTLSDAFSHMGPPPAGWMSLLTPCRQPHLRGH